MVKKLNKKAEKKGSKKAELKKVEDNLNVDQIKKTKIRVIGIGGGGGNIVSEIASKVSKAGFVVANTDVKSLKSCSRKVTKFQFGQNLTHGLGTGMDYELGKAAAQSEKERIKKICQGQDLCILVASLGGGTGSGAASVFAKASKESGNLTYGIFTLPFKFEGEKKMEIAINSLREAKGHFNAITIIPNEKVFQVINKDTPLKEALSTINKFLSESLGGLIETIYEPGLINIDFADFKTILEGSGRLAYLNTVEGQRREGAIKEISTKVLNSPFYPYTSRGAKGVLFNIVGEKDLSLSDVNQISKAISELVNPEAKIIFGVSQSKKASNVIKTTLLATGCDRTGGVRIFSSKNELSYGKKVRKKKKKKKEKVEKAEVVPKNKTKKTAPKKTKIKFQKKAKDQKTSEPEEEREGVVKTGSEEKIRKNALQIKKEVEEVENEMVEKERFWETPAFLRKKNNQ